MYKSVFRAIPSCYVAGRRLQVFFFSGAVVALAIAFDDEVNPTSDKLLDTIPDVLFAADQTHQLLPGYPLPTGGERLIGTSVSFKAVAREPSLVPTAEFVPPPHWEEGDAIRSELLSHSRAIDVTVETLREKQAKLWEEYQQVTPREQVDNFAAKIRSAKRKIERLREANPDLAKLADETRRADEQSATL